jgi:hypothetical protein
VLSVDWNAEMKTCLQNMSLLFTSFLAVILATAINVPISSLSTKDHHSLLILKLRRSGSTYFTSLVSQQQGVWYVNIINTRINQCIIRVVPQIVKKVGQKTVSVEISREFLRN